MLVHGGVSGGFPDPVHSAQTAFRAVMDAMACPGRIVECPIAAPPAPLNGVAGAVVLTLCDADTPIWLDRALAANDDVRLWLSFHCGTKLADDPGQAAFAVADGPGGVAQLPRLATGSQDYPDRSATLLVQVPGFEAEPDWTLTGPGIDGSRMFRPAGLPDAFLSLWNANRMLFPRGADIIFAAPAHVAALPRTTRLSTGGGR